MHLQTLVFILVILIAAPLCEANQDRTSNFSYSPRFSIFGDDQTNQNEIKVDRNVKDGIRLEEPYNSLMKTAVRLSLSQSSLSNYFNIDAMMNFVNSTAYLMSNASTLIRVIKIVTIIAGLLISLSLLYPPLLKNIMQDPMHAIHLEQFLSNGINEKSMLGMLSSTTDDFLNTIGLRDNTCREKSICFAGEVLRCSLPDSVDAVTKFASDKLSDVGLSEHKYVRAFTSGFLDGNCAKIEPKAGNLSLNCFSNMFFNRH